MKIIEYRIYAPLTMEEFPLSQRYVGAKASTENSGDGEGVEVILNEPYEKDGHMGRHTITHLHIASKTPSYIRRLLPRDALIVIEECWDCFPYTKSVYKNLWLKDRLGLITETIHAPGVSNLENPTHLSPEDLKKRKVDIIDIALPMKKSKEYKCDVDPSVFHSEKTNRGPLKPGWWKQQANGQKQNGSGPSPSGTPISPTSDTQSPNPSDETQEPLPVTTAHKVAKFWFRVPGLSTIAENFAAGVLKSIYEGAIRQQFCWIDEWYGMTEAEISAYEHGEIAKQKDCLLEDQVSFSDNDDEDGLVRSPVDQEEPLPVANHEMQSPSFFEDEIVPL
ncbi:putative Phosphatidylinositol transfer protein 1 [Blattamonas nauphoetae]|uniref:Phosphatidylinositol transfer protein 1 n=1 Tax=Blattamonas nauphoetae TaxID=2049346 RepID=A0ABQ9XHG6_9EUKA|nr:putative Phosphatidylinositol transfer protein 1 [Blattamonas nauphoetae]